MLSRRKFTALLGAAIASLSLPFPAIARSVKPQQLLSIDQLCALMWPIVLQDMRGDNKFASRVLNEAVADGRIRFMALGARVELYSGELYDIEQFNVPVMWSKLDEARNHTEASRTAIAHTLCENAIFSLDYMMEEVLQEHDLVVSKHYHYEKGDTMVIESQSAFYFQVFTAMARLPKGTLCRRR